MPIMNLCDDITERIAELIANSRWKYERRGFMSPSIHQPIFSVTTFSTPLAAFPVKIYQPYFDCQYFLPCSASRFVTTISKKMMYNTRRTNVFKTN